MPFLVAAGSYLKGINKVYEISNLIDGYFLAKIRHLIIWLKSIQMFFYYIQLKNLI